MSNTLNITVSVETIYRNYINFITSSLWTNRQYTDTNLYLLDDLYSSIPQLLYYSTCRSEAKRLFKVDATYLLSEEDLEKIQNADTFSITIVDRDKTLAILTPEEVAI